MKKNKEKNLLILRSYLDIRIQEFAKIMVKYQKILGNKKLGDALDECSIKLTQDILEERKKANNLLTKSKPKAKTSKK